MRATCVLLALLFMTVPVHANSLDSGSASQDSSSNAMLTLSSVGGTMFGTDSGALPWGTLGIAGTTTALSGTISTQMGGTWFGTDHDASTCFANLSTCAFGFLRFTGGSLTLPETRDALVVLSTPVQVEAALTTFDQPRYTFDGPGLATVALRGSLVEPDLFFYSVSSFTVTFQAVPEPATWLLLASGAVPLAYRRLIRHIR